jgi:hypothetical protein
VGGLRGGVEGVGGCKPLAGYGGASGYLI